MKLIGPLNSGQCSCLIDDVNQDSNHPVKGKILGVYVSPNFSCLTGALQIDIKTANNPIVNILTVTTETAAWYYPRPAVHSPTNGSAIANQYADGIPIHDFVNVALTAGLDGDNVDVWLLLEE